jgi:6-pyruvoyl-tetrahydropterin synthase related domain
MTVPRTSSTSFRSRRLPGWLLALGVSFVLSILIVLPFFWLGTASGHDFEFHAASWFDAAYQWKEGILYPRWTAWTNHGFGEPRFVFYPPLSWMLGAALTLLLPDPAVPILFVVLVQTFAGLSTFFLLRHLTAHRTAVLGAAVYVINPNALLMTYIRSDFAEQLACAIFPLLLLGALRLCDFLEDSPSTRSSLVLFAIPFAGVWLSNAPAAVIASYSMALLFAYAAISQRSWRPLLRGLAALALGLGLVAFYLVPAAYEQRWVNIGQALSSGLLPSQNFLFTAIDDPEHTWFNWIASICALSLMLLLGLATLASRRLSPTSNAGARNRQASLGLLLLGAGATMLTLRLSLPLWTYLPKLRFVQFPWRCMSMIALVATCFVAFAMQRRRAWLWLSALFLLSVSLGYFQVTNTWWDEDEMPTLRDALVSGNGLDGTDEYDPIGDDHLDLPIGAPLVKVLPPDSEASSTQQVQLQIQRWSTEQKQIRIDSPSEARVALRLLNYPAWRVRVNGKLISTERMDDVNQMVVPIESGHSDIRVEFIRTTDRKLGNAISTVCAALCVVLLWIDRKQSTKSVSFRNETHLSPVD